VNPHLSARYDGYALPQLATRLTDASAFLVPGCVIDPKTTGRLNALLKDQLGQRCREIRLGVIKGPLFLATANVHTYSVLLHT